MKTIGIICEYNPFHNGHKKQIDHIRTVFGEDCTIVCLMSGSFVQRGHPALLEKSLRAEAALICGADLVLELPVTYALSSAEGFAAGGVKILSQFCDVLCFGAETGNQVELMNTAKVLLSDGFSRVLREKLETGISFPAARQAALADMGCGSGLLEKPNDILAVEYCKAILSQGSTLQPFVITRHGSYHADTPDLENPSATSLRNLAVHGADWGDYVPTAAKSIFESGALHTLSAGERAILARLRTMSDADYEALPYGSEGLWRKLMRESRRCATLEQILTAVKSKRYTRSRLDRMVMCAFLGLTRDDLAQDPPYVRVLGFGDRGRTVLNKARETGLFPHIGEKTGDAYETLELRWESLYGLFRADVPGDPDAARKQRICIRNASC